MGRSERRPLPRHPLLRRTLHKMTESQLRSTVESVVGKTPVIDLHTHIYPPAFGPLSLWGIDEFVTYHYLIAEVMRYAPVTPQQYWAMSKTEQADLIWKYVFVENTPISEAARGVVCVLNAFGLDAGAKDLTEARKFFAARKNNVDAHIDDVFRLAGVTRVVMTNDVFNPNEAKIWNDGVAADPRFSAALRMDPLINNWTAARATIEAAGGDTDETLTQTSIASARKFLDNWIAKMKPLYMAVSMPYDFIFPDDTVRTEVIREVVIPTARAHNLPFALMIGVRRQINPLLGDAGDGVGKADVAAVVNLCRDYPDVRFLITMLSRENQHELCVTARKFANLMPFGCWWFLNNPSIIDEMTSQRIELLGSSFIPQHSDARILEQVIYKWIHSRRIIANVLTRNYSSLAADGYPVTEAAIQRDVTRMFSANFEAVVSAAAGQGA
jgi:hypothetical protein